MNANRPLTVDSPFGKQTIDVNGSPIGAARMDASLAYTDISRLLKEVIDAESPDAWKKIRTKIDYIYTHLDTALNALEKETGFYHEIRTRLETGQKLLFKPNVVSVHGINPHTHSAGVGYTASVPWPFLAALMRWFHDRLDISYYRMAVGEASPTIVSAAAQYSVIKSDGKPVTTEAVIEGRSENFYGGWGFYFVRRYLADTIDPASTDNPMNGFKDSENGTYIPPGLASDKLMVYDLNRTFDDAAKGRAVRVPDGVNFKSIALHKAIVGGDPKDPDDIKAYPGAVLVNVPKLKVHSRTLFTNAIKNLGIGLYPIQSTCEGGYKWDYARPHNAVPGIKFIPHQVWIPVMDHEKNEPKRDAAGNYMVVKTGGIIATMVDVIKAAASQSVFMIHVVDSIETTNLEHGATGLGKLVPEGLVFAALDPVALDLLCARYMFKNVPLDEAVGVDLDDGAGGRFIQRVPIPAVEDSQIVTKSGYDCPLARDSSFAYAMKRGLGQTAYYVAGSDVLDGTPLISLRGHLGKLKNGVFSELTTQTLYYDVLKLPWDMQKTTMGYLESVDRLTGSDLKQEFLNLFDENGDGVADYHEDGKRGNSLAYLAQAAMSSSMAGLERFGNLVGPFCVLSRRLRWSDQKWNQNRHDIFKEPVFASVCWVAYRMSQNEREFPDLYAEGLIWGNGKWPSFLMAKHMYLGGAMYGGRFPDHVSFPGLYSLAFRYADLTQNDGRYTGAPRTAPNPEALSRYFSDVEDGRRHPLDFTFYVPERFDLISGSKIPNTAVTDDPALILTAHFEEGNERWPREIRI